MCKTLVAVLGFVALGCVLGCEQTPAERRADAVREGTQERADHVRDVHDDAAEAVRDQAGKTITGAAQTDEAERRADQLESAGERRADNIEDRGESRADRIEDTDDNATDRLNDPVQP